MQGYLLWKGREDDGSKVEVTPAHNKTKSIFITWPVLAHLQNKHSQRRFKGCEEHTSVEGSRWGAHYKRGEMSETRSKGQEQRRGPCRRPHQRGWHQEKSPWRFFKPLQVPIAPLFEVTGQNCPIWQFFSSPSHIARWLKTWQIYQAHASWESIRGRNFLVLLCKNAGRDTFMNSIQMRLIMRETAESVPGMVLFIILWKRNWGPCILCVY